MFGWLICSWEWPSHFFHKNSKPHKYRFEPFFCLSYILYMSFPFFFFWIPKLYSLNFLITNTSSLSQLTNSKIVSINSMTKNLESNTGNSNTSNHARYRTPISRRVQYEMCEIIVYDLNVIFMLVLYWKYKLSDVFS